MKKFIVYLTAVTLLFSGVSLVWAVEKKQKETTPSKSSDQTSADSTKKSDNRPAGQGGKQPTKPEAKKPAPEKKYDNFVDKNNNGVDDRRENLKKKDGK